MEEINALKAKKCQEEFKKFLKESPLQNTIDRISREIIEKKNSEAALGFTRIICELLKENGVHVKYTEYRPGEEITEDGILHNCVFGFELDFSEHDKDFQKQIKELKSQIQKLESELAEKESEEKQTVFSAQEYIKQMEETRNADADGGQDKIKICTNGITREYSIDQITEMVRSYEDIRDCKEHNGEHLHSEEHLKILSLNEQIARLERIWERKTKEIEKLKQENDELKADNAEMHCELQAINANPINNYVKELEDVHQSDCIRINQMSTTIDVLVEKLAKTRECCGL